MIERFATTGAGTLRVAGMICAGRGDWLKSNAPAMLVAVASRRVSGASPQFSSMNLSPEVKSRVVWSTYPLRAYGLTRIAGTRKPYPKPSTCGGRTWSYQPPQSSYESRNAELFQLELAIRLLITVRTKRIPDWTLPGGCSLAPEGAMYATDGRVPFARSS